MEELPTPTMPLVSLSRPGFGRAARGPRQERTNRDGRPCLESRSAGRTVAEVATSGSVAGHAPDFEVIWARHLDDVRAAQRLRHEVFVGEIGARLTTPAHAPAGHDVDLFDDFC